mmetsp:Transcript_15555/g.14086  ORF Transcript_15555/g.14086 Transcript_15555/m.14086 type:complete len:183 (+) Transcript_15555:165-713(+)
MSYLSFWPTKQKNSTVTENTFSEVKDYVANRKRIFQEEIIRAEDAERRSEILKQEFRITANDLDEYMEKFEPKWEAYLSLSVKKEIVAWLQEIKERISLLFSFIEVDVIIKLDVISSYLPFFLGPKQRLKFALGVLESFFNYISILKATATMRRLLLNDSLLVIEDISRRFESFIHSRQAQM